MSVSGLIRACVDSVFSCTRCSRDRYQSAAADNQYTIQEIHSVSLLPRLMSWRETLTLTTKRLTTWNHGDLCPQCVFTTTNNVFVSHLQNTKPPFPVKYHQYGVKRCPTDPAKIRSSHECKRRVGYKGGVANMNQWKHCSEHACPVQRTKAILKNRNMQLHDTAGTWSGSGSILCFLRLDFVSWTTKTV